MAVCCPGALAQTAGMIEPLLLTACQMLTFAGETSLTNGSSFFFERDGRLFVATSRHVVRDEPSGHAPDRVEIKLHVDEENMADSLTFSIPLYEDGEPLWREGVDGGGPVDIAVIEVDRAALPETVVFRAFTPSHLLQPPDRVEIASSVAVVGFPLGFHDTLHHMPVARQAVLASSFGLRFQGQGYFLTDGRTHRGISGGPVAIRALDYNPVYGDLPWRLLGVHSARLDIGGRDREADEALGLNCTWYADMLMTLTEG